jgi:hypothetical protein
MTKALIRKEGEVITEECEISIDWTTGMPLTNPDWTGGPYTLIENYIPPAEDIVSVDVISESQVTEDVIDASKAEQIAELKKLLAELEK